MKHKPHSLAGQLQSFFAANPDECLASADMVAKFGCTKRAAHVAIFRLGLRRSDGCYAPPARAKKGGRR